MQTLRLILLFSLCIASSYQNPVLRGKKIDINLAPYMAVFEFNNKQICGAAIISSQWLVSAAHCFNADRDIRQHGRIRVGTSSKETGGTVFKIKNVINHPGFKRNKVYDDIALIEVEGNIDFNENQNAIAVVNSADVYKVGTKMQIVGMGCQFSPDKRHFNEIVASSHLNSAKVEIDEDSACDALFRHLKMPKMRHEIQFCAKSAPSGVCKGDSGGPAVVDNHLVGVISLSYDWGNEDYPDTYTKVFHYRDWISRETNLVL
ncbi:hypothetical protein TKK_0002416 [Trichogramma kaykai]|uniref:trypsin n=1 Tax=Trichogramma kaykai TaxID=54128 RepID=A0ABD2VWY4_9HYME